MKVFHCGSEAEMAGYVGYAWPVKGNRSRA